MRAVATDRSGNISEKTVSFFVIADPKISAESVDEETGEIIPASGFSGPLSLLSPKSGKLSSKNTSFSFFVPKNLRIASNTIEVNIQKKTGVKMGKKTTIYKISGEKIPASGSVSFSYKFAENSDYVIQLRVKGGQASKKVLVRVEE